MTVQRLMSLHNLHFYGELVRGARDAIRNGTWAAHKKDTLARMASETT
jgi:tRNA-guanine family transglycosylase